MRFLRDWEEFRAKDWPIIHYESLVTDPEETLKQCCNQLGIPWHKDMLLWPKSPSEIPRVEGSNKTFRASLSGQGFEECVIKPKEEINTRGISKEDLSWLEKTFSEYNKTHSYPEHVPQDNAALLPDRPKYLSTQHQKSRNQIKILSCELENCKAHISEILQSKSWKITAPARYIFDIFKKK
jgi:hypothetical protein